jgi:hypothetical protein
VIAAGIAADGTAGLFLSDNLGGQLRPLAVLAEDPADRITDLAVSATGNVITFVHDHSPGELAPGEPVAHIHQIVIPGLTLIDLDMPDVLPTHLVGGDSVDTVSWVLDTSTASSITQFLTRDDVHVSEHRAEPVGFLADGTAVLMARPVPSRTGPGDVWLAPPTGPPVLLIESVDAVATRTVIGPWIDLPADIEAQAPG